MVKRLRWHVVFEDLDKDSTFRRLLSRCLRTGFQHCWAFRDTDGGMLVVNQNIGFLEIEVVPGLTAEAWAEFCRGKGKTVLVLDVEVDAHRWTPRVGNCVSIIRKIAGWSAWAQTPSGLARAIRRHMGGSAKPKRPTNSERNAAMLSARKGDRDALAISEQEAFLKRSRRRSSVFGGPESGLLGGATATLGVGA